MLHGHFIVHSSVSLECSTFSNPVLLVVFLVVGFSWLLFSLSKSQQTTALAMRSLNLLCHLSLPLYIV
jgi:hypothetical protein